MATQFNLGDITIDVTFKDIKNIHLSVYPPNGAVRIAAPEHMSLDTIRAFAIGKLGWIKQQQQKLREQIRETPREYLDRESHYVWGERFLLKTVEIEAAPGVELKHGEMHLRVRPGTSHAQKQATIAEWYRAQVKAAAASLIVQWAPLLGVTVERVFLQQMKTKWGSCNPTSWSIRLNTELAKKPHDCLEYIVVHELVHLLEPTHNGKHPANTS
jgi:predicted metal-dependent hydrolase